MKKIYTYITFIALAALAVGCAKELVDSSLEETLAQDTLVQEGEVVTIVFNVPDSPDTKTALGTKDGSSYPVKWSNGDQNRISLNGSTPTASTKDSDTQISATFKPAAGLSVYNFLYRGDDGHDNQVTIPAAQTYYANDFDDAAMPMYAASATRSNTVTFNSLCSLLKFSITGEKKIDSVTLTAADGSKSLSGTFTIGKTGAGLLNGTLTPASGGGSINYNFGGHIQLSETPFVFYVAIPAGTYEGGITLEIVDNASGHMTATVMNTNATKTIAAGKVREFNNIVYIPDVEQNLHQIYNVATFQSFVSAVAGGKKTLNARLTQNAATLDLSSIASSFESIEDYKGIFDGNGKAISFGTTTATQPLFNELRGVVKNLTVEAKIAETDVENYEVGIFARSVRPSNEVDDIAGLQNCTANGSVTYTPSDAVSGNACIGGLIGNNRGGTITGCTNNATVTFANNGSSTVHAMQPSIGGVVGRTQKGGDLSTQGDISNNTNAGTVVCSAKFSQGIYLGGVLGYQVEKAESISGCTNSGLVKATASCSTTGPLHIGGVIGLGKGSIESCSNLAAGTVTTEACSVGTYLCQGGVIGRMNNTSGTYTGLTNAGNVNVAASGASTGEYIGGIVGRCNEGAAVSDCINTAGTIEFTGEISTCELHIGGIVGNTNKPVSNCTNATAIIAGGTYSLNSSGKYYSVGGIVGLQSADEALTNNTNNAAITFSGTSTGYTAVGGVVGYCNGAISGGGNAGTVTFSGSSNTQNIPIGGVAARTPSGKSGDRISGVTNSGAIVINTDTQTKKTIYVGGVVGHHQSGDFTATNSGTLTVTSLTCTNLILGGLAGQTAGAILSGSANQAAGDISIAGLTSNQDSYIGGVVGKCTSSVTANNAGDVVLTSGSSAARSLFVGGVVGRAEGALSSCTNSGLVSNAAPMTGGSSYFMQIGGVVGYNNGSAPLSDCHNTGNVTNTADSNSYQYVGGITSESDAAISNCDNTGDVTNSGASGNGKPIAVGGIAGKANSALTSCSNGTSSAAGGTISNSGASAEDVCLGGVAGINEGQTFTTCYNKGAVTNSGTGGSLAIGGLAGWSSASSTYTSACYNNGAISNSGTGSDGTAGVRMGGIVGSARANTLSASGANKTVNYGSVTDESSCNRIALAGIVGFTDDAASDFSNCRNEGTITIGSGEKKYIYMGGIAGLFKNSSVIDNTYNSGLITGDGASMASTGYLRLGGIIGGWHNDACTSQTITGCTNTGAITFTSDDLLLHGSGAKPDCYVGGIAGGGNNDGVCGKALVNCTNSGAITMGSSGSTNSGKMQHMFVIGGIVGYTDVNPTGSKCIANIRFRSSKGTNRVGGIAGEMMISEIHDVTYKGNVNTNGCSGTNFTGGLVGNVGTGTVTFTNCTVYGTMYGPNSTTVPAGIFCSCNGGGTGPTINIASCTVGSGTRRRVASSGSSQYVTITSADQITADYVFGHNGSNRNLTTGTNDGLSTVVDPGDITL